MNIGFDAKRAYHNSTGLGFFSRILIDLLASHYSEHKYYLFNPRQGALFRPSLSNIHEVLPARALHKVFSSAWRSRWVVGDMKRLPVHLYHGLSQEIPVGIPGAGIASVVTIHDLFPELYPKDFQRIDVKIYRTKLRYSCRKADQIMAISDETKKHIVERYKIDPGKITVAYQSCDPVFNAVQDDAQKEAVRLKYNLPADFFLHVGTIIERKNLLNICKALQLIQKDVPVPLIVVGNGGSYKEKVKQYLAENNLQHKVIFLSERCTGKGQTAFVETKELHALYQLAKAMIYPSFYEGFGMPIIEAMASGTPVITSETSCMPEIGGGAAFYVNPNRPAEMAEGLKRFYEDDDYRQKTIHKGYENAGRFAPDIYVRSVMGIYNKALKVE